MTQTTVATVPVIKALLDEARRANYPHGVLGVRARPEWTEGTFDHDDVPVSVVPCVSALAVREALLDRQPGSWLVVLTDRENEDLGTGILSHLAWNKLRRPDPWEAVRNRFAATGLDPMLTNVASQHDLAAGLLAAAPPAGWPPAPGGVLTRDHAFASVVRAHLGIDDPQIDALTVLAWTADPSVSVHTAALRALAGDTVTDEVLAWLSRRVGAAGEPVGRLLRDGRAAEILPVGLVLGVVVAALSSVSSDDLLAAQAALIRLEPIIGGPARAQAAAAAWAPDAQTAVTALLHEPDTRTLAELALAAADQRLADIDAVRLAGTSTLLPSGLRRRLATLADAVRAAASTPTAPGSLVGVEHAWSDVTAHELADADHRTHAFHAAVRLTRWLAEPDEVLAAELPPLVDRHAQTDGWVDAAVNDASPGVGEPDLGAALSAVLDAVRQRRDEHDASFARALASYTSSEGSCVLHLEKLMVAAVLPLASKTPVLFLLLDGMSVGVATEVVDDILSRTHEGWVEALIPGRDARAAAVAALPTLTEVSRASLFCGELTRGGQDVETKGLAALSSAYGLSSVLFHKKPLDSSQPGFAVAHDVRAAVEDVERLPLVACVLNTIDDALDRSDPGGTDWGAETVRNLAPLLERARVAGRTVVITADHGHVVERRLGTMRSYPAITSGRSRSAEPPAAGGEVLIEGSRVVTPDHRAVLAVDERVRFGPLKAGYHGGASPAEAVVPVVVLVPGAIPDGSGLTLAPPQQPLWWDSPSVLALRPPSPPAATTAPAHGTLSLFDAVDASAEVSDEPTVAAVLGSTTYRAQKSLAPRLALDDQQISALLSALLTAPATRLTSTQAAQSLGVAPLAVRGAVIQVQALLNVDGYPVLRLDADGSTLVLDAPLLREQFEIGS